METEKRELWHQLENEPRTAFEAFQTFLSLPSGGRTVVEAYRSHVGNPGAVKPSDTWSKWSRDFAWSLRAEARDDHLASLRREAYEQVIKEQAARQAREVEKTRYRYNELMTLGYVQAAEWLENAQPSDLRGQDVLQIIRLHMDAVKAFEADRESNDEDDWTEEDDAAAEQILKEIDSSTDLERPEGEEEDGEDSENTESDLE